MKKIEKNSKTSDNNLYTKKVKIIIIIIACLIAITTTLIIIFKNNGINKITGNIYAETEEKIKYK